jgi:hypothetical protein
VVSFILYQLPREKLCPCTGGIGTNRFSVILDSSVLLFNVQCINDLFGGHFQFVLL